MLPIIYTSPTCGPCKTVLKWLQANNIIYEERMGADHIEEIEKLTGRAQVPVLVYKDHIITGFNPSALRKAFPV